MQEHRTSPARSRADTGWRLAGLVLLFVITLFWMPLGARDAGGVSSVLPSLRSVSLAQPAGLVSQATDLARAQVGRPPAPVRGRFALALPWLVSLAVAVLVVVVPDRRDRVERSRLRHVVRSRAPPLVP